MARRPVHAGSHVTIELHTLFSVIATVLVSIIGWLARTHASQLSSLRQENKDQGKTLQGFEVRLATYEQRTHDTNKHVENFRDELATIREHMARREDLAMLQESLTTQIRDAFKLSGPRKAPRI